VDGLPICIASGTQQELVATKDSTGGAIFAWTDYRDGTADIYAHRVTGGGEVVAVEGMATPAVHLSAPRPNPSSGPVEIRLDLPESRAVTARVLDVRGRSIATIAHERILPSGPSVLRWDGRDDADHPVAAGLYFVQVKVGSDTNISRAVILN
jgi:hypothetical protein